MDCLCRLALFRSLIKPKYCFKPSRLNSSKASEKTSWNKRIFSGIQPTGSLHLGNYYGAIKQWVKLQDEGEDVIYSIVDLHAITLPQEPKKLSQNIFDCAATLLACGIDPDKSILFLQSTISYHAELSWVLNCLTTMPRLGHLPQYKEKSAMVKDVPLGLYVYPVLQSADILLYKATHVPVGEDQIQHLQLANHLAHTFNNRFGTTFPPVKPLTHGTGRLRSLRNPEKKMSKSDPDPRSRIDLCDEPDVIMEKLRKAVTDCTSEVTYDPENRRAVATLVELMALSTGRSPQQVCEDARGIDTGQFKLRVADAICEALAPVREERRRLLAEPNYLRQVLAFGAERAYDIATDTWVDVSKKTGIGL